MGKASRMKNEPDRRSRIAAQREAERRRQQRKRIYWAGGSIIVIVIVALSFVIFKGNGGTAAVSSEGPTGAALAQVTSQVTGVPASVTDQVAGGGVETDQLIPQSGIAAATQADTGYLATVSGAALTEGGKPEMLYMGAEYCPYCAAERWAVINALSRFGTFTGLTTTHSSSTDAYANTPTYTFYGSTYTSKYIAFTSVEETKNYRIGNSTNTSVPYVTLQTPTAAQSALGETYDSGGSIPFIDLANKYVDVGNLAPWGPQLLAGKTWAQVAAAMSQPDSAIGKAAIGNANYLTAAICKITGNQPASACTSTIQSLEKNLAKA
jgi:thiol-disulfide isomerase/thioredoxin